MSLQDGSAKGSLSANPRSQSEVLGFVLVFSIMVLGALIIVALGASVISSTEQSLSEDRAEKALTQFDSKAGLVALGEADTQRVSLPTGSTSETFSLHEEAGRMTVTVENRTTGEAPDWVDDGELVNSTLGALTYESGETRLAYQGGGVWRSDERGGKMVSPPEFHFRGGTLTLPTVTLAGEGQLGERATISKGQTQEWFPIAEENVTNPLTNHEVVVTVQSDFYRGWGSYFEERTDGTVDYDDEEQTATLTLRTPAGEQRVVDSVGATSVAGNIAIEGDGTVDYNTDSYDSRIGPYDESATGSGNITLAGDVDVNSASIELRGSIQAAGTVDCHQNAVITGSVAAGTFVDESDCESAADGTSNDVPDFDDTISLTPYIEEQVSEIQQNDDSEGSNSDIESGELLYEDDVAVIESGEYYLDEFVVESGDTVDIQTEGELVRLAVENYVDIDDDTSITVSGDGRVELFLNGSVQTETYGGELDEAHFAMGEGTVTTSEEVQYADRFWVYGKDDMVVSLAGAPGQEEPIFEGVFYAPSLGETGGDISVVDLDGATVYGGIIAGDINLEQSSVLYDEALQEHQAVPEDASVATINYLHLTTNEIIVD